MIYTSEVNNNNPHANIQGVISKFHYHYTERLMGESFKDLLRNDKAMARIRELVRADEKVALDVLKVPEARVYQYYNGLMLAHNCVYHSVDAALFAIERPDIYMLTTSQGKLAAEFAISRHPAAAAKAQPNETIRALPTYDGLLSMGELIDQTLKEHPIHNGNGHHNGYLVSHLIRLNLDLDEKSIRNGNGDGNSNGDGNNNGNGRN